MRSIINVKSTIWGMIYKCTIYMQDWREGRSMGVECGIERMIA